MKRVASDREEREIEALFQQDRTPFESDEDRLERLQYELEQQDRKWTASVQKRERRDHAHMLIWMGIILVGLCTFWLAVALFFWRGAPWPTR